MPLRDHFHPPLSRRIPWDGFHGAWPTVIVQTLLPRLPQSYVAMPHIHLGSAVEIDVGTFKEDEAESSGAVGADDHSGGVATATWAPPRPTLTIPDGLLDVDEYEVRVYDPRDGRQLVAAVEIVSPSNKDRPEHRRVFVAKCAALLQDQVCVTIVDLITTRTANLYRDLLDLLGQADPALADGPPPLYAVTLRRARGEGAWRLETWAHPLALGRPLPTLPLWLAEDLAVPLDLEASYEETCRILRIV